MQALILAGGKGSRLRPYTTILPKPLMPIGDYPILEILLRQLKNYGVKEVIIAIGYLGHLIQTFLGDGSRLGIKIKYSFEESPLGTAGPIGVNLEYLKNDFLVLNGDLLTTLNFKSFFDYHKKTNSVATIALHHRQVKVDFGVIETDKDQNLSKYIEKPTYNFLVSMGINVFKKSEIVKYFSKQNAYLDIPELMTNLKEDGYKVSCYTEDCLWLDIGRSEDYVLAQDLFEQKKSTFIVESFE